MKAFSDMIEEAQVRAQDYSEPRYLADGEGIWKHYAPCEEGFTPDIALEVSPNGEVRLIENRAVPYDEIAEALRCVLKARENAMHAAASGNGALFDAAQEDVQDAVRKAQVILYKLPE